MTDISGDGWEILITRRLEQQRGIRRRTVGTYQVFHNGERQDRPDMKGTTAESRGPGANRPASNGKRIEEGRYPLETQGTATTKYRTLGFVDSQSSRDRPKPGFELAVPGPREGILIHPGVGFLASIGCFNPCTSLPDEDENIDFPGSRRRVIALIDDMKEFLGRDFPRNNERPIPRAFAVVDREP